MPEQTMEQQAAALDNAYAADGATGTQQESQQKNNGSSAAPTQPANGFNPEEFRAFMAEVRADRNRINSQLGQFGKRTSELDRFLAEQNKPKSPQSWDKLDAPTQAATRELVKHLVEELYGEKFKSWDNMHSTFREQERNGRILGIANQILGEKYKEYDKALGDIYTDIKMAAQGGNTGAERFLKDIHESDSGVYRLVEMAKAKVSQGIQAQGDRAKIEREQAAQRAANGVRGNAQAPNGKRGDGLPADKAERQRTVAAMIDEANKRT